MGKPGKPHAEPQGLPVNVSINWQAFRQYGCSVDVVRTGGTTLMRTREFEQISTGFGDPTLKVGLWASNRVYKLLQLTQTSLREGLWEETRQVVALRILFSRRGSGALGQQSCGQAEVRCSQLQIRLHRGRLK